MNDKKNEITKKILKIIAICAFFPLILIYVAVSRKYSKRTRICAGAVMVALCIVTVLISLSAPRIEVKDIEL